MEGGQTNSQGRTKSNDVALAIVGGMTRRRRVVATGLAVLAGLLATAAASGASTRPAAVVRAWSKALNAADDRAAGALFARNAVTIQGPVVVRLRTARSAAVWNSGLPCSGQIVSIQVVGNVATATFRLGERPGHVCDGPGNLVAARFTVVAGKIVRWEQVPPPVPGRSVL